METNANTTEAAVLPNALERSLDLTVAISELDKEIEQRLKRIGKTAKMPGFRQGKVPTKIIQQQYGYEARMEALNESLDRVFGDAVKAAELRVAGQPKIEAVKSESETHLEFKATFEVYPEIVLADMTGAEIEKPVLEVGDAEVDSTIEVLRKQRTRYEATDRAAAKGDRVTIDFHGTKGGEPFPGGQAKDFPFTLGEGSMLADFEAAVDGLKIGESKTFDMTFPADYFAPDLAGQAVTFEVTVKHISAPVMPEVDAEFAKSLGIESGDVAEMRKEIETNLKREVKSRLESKLKDNVMQAILAANPIDIPNAVVEMEIERLMDAARKDMEQRTGKKDFPIQREWFVEQAKRRVSLGLIVADVVKVNELHAKPEQIKALVDEAAENYEQPEEVVRWYYAQPQRIAEMEGIAIENNVVGWVMSKAKVTDKAMSFDELMGQQGR